MLGGGSRGDKGFGLVPIYFGSCHLVRVLEAEARKLKFAPLSRQLIMFIRLNWRGIRLRMNGHTTSVHAARIGFAP